MNLTRTTLVLILAIALAGFAGADDFTTAVLVTLKNKESDPRKMHEDVEVLRRILDRTLKLPRYKTGYANAQPGGFTTGIGLQGAQLGGLANPLLNPNPLINGGLGSQNGGLGGIGGLGPIAGNNIVTYSELDSPMAEGVYLKGHGVVYTLVLPPIQPAAANKVEKTPANPLSEWDRIRKELRGEKVDADAKPAQKKEPSLADQVLKVLMENGHHFSELAENESVTVVITFRQGDGEKTSVPNALINLGIAPIYDVNFDEASQGALGTYKVSDLLLQVDRQQGGSPTGDPNQVQSTVPFPPDSKDAPKQNKPKPPAKASDNILLGQLHLKQGDYKKALEAFKNALKSMDDFKDDPAYNDLLRDMAQALLGDGQFDQAKKVLEDLLARSTKKPAVKQPALTQPLPLPAKLIISAPKNLLDRVGTGKVTLEEFANAATVEYVNMPAANKNAPKK